MASPVGHVVLGLAVARGGGGERSGRHSTGVYRDPARTSAPPWLLPTLAAVAAVAPDLDFLPGILVGDPNRYHQLHSHTLLAAASAGLLAGVAARSVRIRGAMKLGVIVALAYASHLLLDFFTNDPRAPFGIPLFWPLSPDHFTSPWSLFRGIHHGVPGQGLGTVLGEIFSLHNLVAVGIEVGATTPALLAAEFLIRRSRGAAME